MPALSPTMNQGNIGAWKKNIGDECSPGDVLVEIETDKAQMDFENQEEGFLAKIIMPEGSKDIPVNTVNNFVTFFSQLPYSQKMNLTLQHLKIIV